MSIQTQNYFRLENGTQIKNLFELSKILGSISEKTFSYHVNENKNDFYNWINDAIKNKQLAEKIKSSKNSKEMQKIIQVELGKNFKKKIEKLQPAKKEKKVIKSTEKKVEAKKQKIVPRKFAKHEVVEKNKNIKKQMLGLFNKKVPKTEFKPETTKHGVECPYKTFQCGFTEFIFGMIIGILLTLIITNLI